VRALAAKLDGEIDVAGPELAGGLTAFGLIDECTSTSDRSSSAAASHSSRVRGRHFAW
jgi:hypothetical protein